MTKKVSRKYQATRVEPGKEKIPVSSLVSERYPKVASIVIHLTYHQKASDPVLMIRTVNFFPSSPAIFNLVCMIKDCVDGGLNFKSIIAKMIKKHKKSGSGKIVCSREKDSHAPDHGTIFYEIKIAYGRKSI